jgi:hypothetical protein
MYHRDIQGQEHLNRKWIIMVWSTYAFKLLPAAENITNAKSVLLIAIAPVTQLFVLSPYIGLNTTLVCQRASAVFVSRVEM